MEGISTNYNNNVTDIMRFIQQSLHIYPDGIFDPPELDIVTSSDVILVNNRNTIMRRVIYTTKDISEHIQYQMYGIIKHNLRVVDNLFYEYLAGVCCLNRLTRKFPIFIYTNGIYVTDREFVKKLRVKAEISGDDIISHLTSMDINSYEDACIKYKKLCLGVQYCPNMTLLSNVDSIPNYKLELGIILFQIYFALSQCRHIFTHYDLHDDNVGVIHLPKNTCIKYIYEFIDYNDTPRRVTFTSRYIVKLFDYGRSYFSGMFPNGTYITSDIILRNVHMIRTCIPTEKYGFDLRFPKYFINQSIVNNSHDLRLLYMLSPILYTIPELSDIPLHIKYDNPFGTRHMPPSNSSIIQTVMDASNVLLDSITSVNPQARISIVDASKKQYELDRCIGTIHVRGLNTDMTFIPN